MDEAFAVLADRFGAETIISAAIVCIVMTAVKKFKPKLSPRAETVIRLIVSFIVHLILTLVVNGQASGVWEGSLGVCGVSMVICTLIAKGGSTAIEKAVEELLPITAEKPSDGEVECKDCVDETKGQFSLLAEKVVEGSTDGTNRPTAV
jgi:hypothetical protein